MRRGVEKERIEVKKEKKGSREPLSSATETNRRGVTRFKPEMWAKVAEEMAIPWRAAEAMHWQLGEQEMARRAGVTPFSLTAQNIDSHLVRMP